MKKKISLIVLTFFVSVLFIQVHAQQTGNWSKHKVKKWFNKKEWLGGAGWKPHPSINKEIFARQYRLNKTYWDEAFSFLKNHNMDSLPAGKYIIDGTNVVATVTEGPTKDFDKTNWESHRKFIDLQCVISGEEKLGVYPVAKATVTKEYDEKSDAANYSAEGNYYIAGSHTFFIFFPADAHRPNITPGGNKVEKKMVIKVRYAE